MDINSVQNRIHEQIIGVAEKLEEDIDRKITELDNLDDDGLEEIRQRRLKQLKDVSRKKQDWVANGHGCYTEISNEKELFALSKNSKRIVCHFFLSTTERCAIFDKHLEIISKKHLETKFIKMNAEKAPFLTNRLNLFVIPTLLIMVGDKVVDRVVGFDDLGGVDDFTTEMLEWRLAQPKAIFYEGDPNLPPSIKTLKSSLPSKKKTIRSTNRSDSSDSD